jgi:hypothetical protein
MPNRSGAHCAFISASYSRFLGGNEEERWGDPQVQETKFHLLVGDYIHEHEKRSLNIQVWKPLQNAISPPSFCRSKCLYVLNKNF